MMKSRNDNKADDSTWRNFYVTRFAPYLRRWTFKHWSIKNSKVKANAWIRPAEYTTKKRTTYSNSCWVWIWAIRPKPLLEWTLWLSYAETIIFQIRYLHKLYITTYFYSKMSWNGVIFKKCFKKTRWQSKNSKRICHNL